MLKGKHFITMKNLANGSIGSNFSSKGCLALCLAGLYPLSEHILDFSDLKVATDKISGALLKGRRTFVGSNGMIKNILDSDKVKLILTATANPNDNNNRKILDFVLKSKIYRYGGQGPNHFVVKFADGTLYDPAFPFFLSNYDSLDSYYGDEGRRIVGVRAFPYYSYFEVHTNKIQ